MKFSLHVVLATSTLFLVITNRSPSDDLVRFDICITAWPSTVLHTLPSGKSWLDAIVEDYGATAVYLDIPWSFLETVPGRYPFETKRHWDMSIDIDGAITAILKKNLNLYVRLFYGLPPADHILSHKSLPDGIRLDVSDTTNDFFRHKNGVARKKGEDGPKLVSFHSSKGERRMLAAHEAAVRHIKELATELGKRENLKEINPTIAWDDETEYPYQYFVCFSDSAKARFQKFLAGKYEIDSAGHGFQRLLDSWGRPSSATTPASLAAIDFGLYNWSDATSWRGEDPTGHTGPISKPREEYDFPGGRNDWIEFRTSQLLGMIGKFSEINRREGIRCCIQIGSAFDYLIEKRGWHDITPLLEDVDGIRTANIVQRKATFAFEADLVRSVCNFWKAQNNREYVFSTETNWPEYKDFDTNLLTSTWVDQLVTFYEAGGSAHFLAGWGFWGEDSKGRRFEDYVEIFRDEYSDWRTTLKNYSSRPLINLPRFKAVYLSTWEGRNTHGYAKEAPEYTDHCEYYIRAVDSTRVENGGQAYGGNRRDIITTFMLIRDPSYLDNYTSNLDPVIITDAIPGLSRLKKVNHRRD